MPVVKSLYLLRGTGYFIDQMVYSTAPAVNIDFLSGIGIPVSSHFLQHYGCAVGRDITADTFEYIDHIEGIQTFPFPILFSVSVQTDNKIKGAGAQHLISAEDSSFSAKIPCNGKRVVYGLSASQKDCSCISLPEQFSHNGIIKAVKAVQDSLKQVKVIR